MISSVIITILIAAQAVVAFYLLLPVWINLAAWLFPVSEADLAEQYGDPGIREAHQDEIPFACVITSYQNKDFALLLVDSLLKQDYSKYHIYVVADRSEPSDNDPVDPRVSMLYPDPPLDLKLKSIDHAFKFIDADSWPYTIVFDADNLAHPRLLSEMNRYAQAGFPAIQCRRTAKNLNTTYACLDAAAEHYYHITQRFSAFRTGVSATIAGSGMAVKTSLYSKITTKVLDSTEYGRLVTEDKLLQNDLIRQGHIIACAHDGLLFDEKIISSGQLQRQRTRWIGGWFSNFRSAAGLIGYGILKGSFNALGFGIVTSSPPLFMLLGSALILTVAGWYVYPDSVVYIAGALLFFALNAVVSLSVAKASRKIWFALLLIPQFILRQMLAALQVKKSKVSFLETAHLEMLTIEDVINDKHLNLYPGK